MGFKGFKRNFLGFFGRFLFLYNLEFQLFTEIIFLVSLYYITIASIIQININNVIDHTKDPIICNDIELVNVCRKIEGLMLEEKLYLNPSLNLSVLSSHVKIPDRLISKSINQIKQINFNRFVHEFRIEEFKNLVDKKMYKKYSIEALAHEVGYNSRASFYKNFKNIVGVSPADYIESIDKRNMKPHSK